jgi:hypothetical protein
MAIDLQRADRTTDWVDKAANYNPMAVAPGTYDPKKGERAVNDK